MERLKIIREKRNITQIRLSVGISVSQETISAYESGKTAVPTLFMIEITKITKKGLSEN